MATQTPNVSILKSVAVGLVIAIILTGITVYLSASGLVPSFSLHGEQPLFLSALIFNVMAQVITEHVFQQAGFVDRREIYVETSSRHYIPNLFLQLFECIDGVPFYFVSVILAVFAILTVNLFWTHILVAEFYLALLLFVDLTYALFGTPVNNSSIGQRSKNANQELAFYVDLPSVVSFVLVVLIGVLIANYAQLGIKNHSHILELFVSGAIAMHLFYTGSALVCMLGLWKTRYLAASPGREFQNAAR